MGEEERKTAAAGCTVHLTSRFLGFAFSFPALFMGSA